MKRTRIKRLKIGTRGSTLALWQAGWVKARIEEAFSGLNVEMVTIKTSGDMILDVPLAKIGGKGLFVKEIENALRAGHIDLAVHSMKDVPIVIPAGLAISCVTKREDPFDVLISRRGQSLRNLPPGAKIGTGSLRRQAQLLHYRPDFVMVPLRGNLDTRIRKLKEQDLDAIVLASVGMRRMGLIDRVTETIPIEICLPAIGQGVLALETRFDDRDINEKITFLNDPETALTMRAERAFLRRLEGGCQVPIAAYVQLSGDSLAIEGMVASVDGKRIVRQRRSGRPEAAETLGLELAETVLSMGGDQILREIYDQNL